MPVNPYILAFGEVKTAKEWQNDERCKVGVETIYSRIYRLKWDHERAISEPPPEKINTCSMTFEPGQKFGYFTFSGKINKTNDGRYAECVCVCGKKCSRKLILLVRGKIKSCGCMKSKGTSVGLLKHGCSRMNGGKKHPLYGVWSGMKQRCQNENNPEYKNYGGRGITVCDYFLIFSNFYEWSINNGWEKGLTLERSDNNGSYTPDNCRWAPMSIQQRNKRTNVIISAFGESKCMTDWVFDERCTVTFGGLKNRIINMKWNSEEAISAPLKRCKSGIK